MALWHVSRDERRDFLKDEHDEVGAIGCGTAFADMEIWTDLIVGPAYGIAESGRLNDVAASLGWLEQGNLLRSQEMMQWLRLYGAKYPKVACYLAAHECIRHLAIQYIRMTQWEGVLETPDGGSA